MLIAVCDDDTVFCEQIRKEIYRYSTEYNLDVVVEVFDSGCKILKNQNYDIVFLDYQMPDVNGLQIAEQIRCVNKECTIIFVTSYQEIVYDTFQYEPFRFLMKPIRTESIYEALNSFRKKRDAYYPILINQNSDVIKINTRDIVYVEASGKNSIIRLVDKYVHCPKTLSKVYSLLPKNCFYKPHRSFVVNLLHIDSYSNHHIKFTNGECAKVSREHIGDFKLALKTYMNDNAI